MRDPAAKTYSCPVEVTLDLIGGRWKPLLLWHLQEHKVLRHGEFLRLVPGITQKMLTQQLRQLEADGLVQRTQYAQMPPRVEYALSDTGQSLQDLLTEFCGWGEQYAQAAGVSIVKPGHDAQPGRCSSTGAGAAHPR